MPDMWRDGVSCRQVATFSEARYDVVTRKTPRPGNIFPVALYGVYQNRV